jgi:CTP:molybdopterin cytidylyltransferase MocA
MLLKLAPLRPDPGGAARRCPDPASMRVFAIVLAAGEGRRVGTPKALLSLGETTFLHRACALVSRPGVAGVVAVIGAEAERVREVTLPPAVTVTENPGWRAGMLSSVLCGLAVAEGQGAEAVLLHPVDHPFVAGETVDRVIEALEDGAFAAVPTHDGRRGHPGGFGREAFAALRAAPPDRGARHVLAENPGRVVEVAGDPGCRRGVNTPADLEAAVREGRSSP